MTVKIETALWKFCFWSAIIGGSAYFGDRLNVSSLPRWWETRNAHWTGSFDVSRLGLHAHKEYVRGTGRWQSFYEVDGARYRILSDGFPFIPPETVLERDDIRIGIEHRADEIYRQKVDEELPRLREQIRNELTDDICATWEAEKRKKKEKKKKWWQF